MDGKPTQTVQNEFLFQELIGDGKAGVTMNVGYAIEFGRAKVSATVHVTCDQSEKIINLAGERAFLKAKELADDGMNYVMDEMMTKQLPQGG